MLTRRSFFSAITGCAATPLIGVGAEAQPGEIVTITPNRDRFMQGDYRKTFEKVAADDAPIEFYAKCLATRAIRFQSEANRNSTLPFKPVSVAFATMGGHHWLEVYFRCDSAFPDATEELLVLSDQRKIRRKWLKKTSAYISDCIASGNSTSKFVVPGISIPEGRIQSIQ